jgi:hypothetical protein
MCRETLPECPQLPNWLAQPVDAEELRFTKRQQWFVAGSVSAVNWAAYTLWKGAHLPGFAGCAVSMFIVLVAAAGIFVLCNLQNSLRDLRKRTEANPPWHRWTDIFWLLTFFVIAVAVGVLVFFFLERPLQSGSRGELFAVAVRVA